MELLKAKKNELPLEEVFSKIKKEIVNKFRETEYKLVDNYCIIFKNLCIQLSKLGRSFDISRIPQMYRILENIKNCKFHYLIDFLFKLNRTPPKEIFKKLLHYHTTEKGKKRTDLVYNNGIISLK